MDWHSFIPYSTYSSWSLGDWRRLETGRCVFSMFSAETDRPIVLRLKVSKAKSGRCYQIQRVSDMPSVLQKISPDCYELTEKTVKRDGKRILVLSSSCLLIMLYVSSHHSLLYIFCCILGLTAFREVMGICKGSYENATPQNVYRDRER